MPQNPVSSGQEDKMNRGCFPKELKDKLEHASVSLRGVGGLQCSPDNDLRYYHTSVRRSFLNYPRVSV